MLELIAAISRRATTTLADLMSCFGMSFVPFWHRLPILRTEMTQTQQSQLHLLKKYEQFYSRADSIKETGYRQ